MHPGPVPYSESVKGKAEIKRNAKMAAKQKQQQLLLKEVDAQKNVKGSKGKEVGSKGSGNSGPVEVVEDLRGKQSLYITSMKNKQKNGSMTQDEKVVLDLYNSLSRMSDEKGVLVSKWLADRSCAWATSYSAAKTVKKSTASSSLEGFGTKFEP
jgi:hypothetical protein